MHDNIEEILSSPFTEIPKTIIYFDILLRALVTICRQCVESLCLSAVQMNTEADHYTDSKNIYDIYSVRCNHNKIIKTI